ncbi:hypothetical protein ACIQLJ_06890 [Microbacterium sp. NPDC091313]
MSARLMFPDPQAATDLLTFASRASRLSEDAVRLQAAGGTLVVTAAALAAQTLLEATPTVLALRVMPVDAELECDLVVPAASLAPVLEDASAVSLPDTAVSAPWAGVSPPRGGWRRVATLPASVLAARAQWGIAAVADTVPRDSGEEIVRTVRSEVWGAADEELAGLPRGVAFAAFALGFIAGDEEAVVRGSGPWTRLTLARGHVLTRTTVRAGLTPVRRTGAA